MNSERMLRDRLLAQETVSPEREELFRKELKKMLEHKLNKKQKAVLYLNLAVSVFLTVAFFYTFLTVPAEFPALARWSFFGGALFSLAWTAGSIWILKKGRIGIKHENLQHVLVFEFTLFLLVILMLLAGQLENRVLGISMMLQGAIFFMIFGLPALFFMRINRSEMTLREHLLKIELQVAELTQKLKKD